MMYQSRIRSNAAEGVRRELFNGRMHTVVPAVILVEGVLNGAFVAADEFGKFAESWNGRPVPILHPVENGEPVSANDPRIIERSAGYVFNATVDGDKLKAEFWLDEQRMDMIGESQLLADLSEGVLMEVSTGYFCDAVADAGEHGGKPYKERHTNLRPDHVALLPGQIGACSIEDGCGAPRINMRKRMTAAQALSAIRQALGLKANCACDGAEGEQMTVSQIVAMASKLQAAGADLGDLAVNFDVAELEKMSEAGRAAVAAALKALDKAQRAAQEDDEQKDNEDEDKPEDNEEEDEPDQNMKANAKVVTMTADDLQKLLDQRDAKLRREMSEASKRAEVTGRILANSRNAFDKAEIASMDLKLLEKYEQSIREADYSGAAGGFAIHRSDDVPLVAPAGLMGITDKSN